jgi:hypothetical protein
MRGNGVALRHLIITRLSTGMMLEEVLYAKMLGKRT